MKDINMVFMEGEEAPEQEPVEEKPAEPVEEEKKEEEVIDYKALVEQEKARVAKISQDYKKQEQEKHQLIQSIAEIKGALEASGIGEITADGKIKVYYNNNQKPEDPIDVINKEKKELKSKFESADIEQDEYIEKISMLNAKLILAEERKANKEEKKQEEVVVKEAPKPEDRSMKLFSSLNTEYPDHNKEGSMLHSEMSKLIMEKADIFGDIDYTDIANVQMRYLLAKEAYARLVDKGVVKAKKTTNASIKNFSTFGGGAKQVDDNRAIGESQEAVIRKLNIKDEKVLKSIFDHARQLDKGQSITIDY